MPLGHSLRKAAPEPKVRPPVVKVTTDVPDIPPSKKKYEISNKRLNLRLLRAFVEETAGLSADLPLDVYDSFTSMLGLYGTDRTQSISISFEVPRPVGDS